MDKDIRTKLEEANEKNYPRVRQEMLAMLSIEERAHAYALEHFPYSPYYEETFEEYKLIAEEQKAIDKELIDKLIDELYTSRAYHLGITGLDSKEEIVRKEKEGDCALIRGIDRTIKYVKEAMED